MASKNFTDWTTPVGYYIKGVGNTEVSEAALHVLRDFCEHTGLWTYDLAAITSVANQSEYDFTDINTDGANVVAYVENAEYKENGAANSQFFDLAVEEYDQWEARKPASWKYETATNPSTILYNHIDSKFRLYPIPTTGSTSGLKVRIAAKPDMAAVKVPVFLWDQWADVITRGIAAHLMGMTNKPWSNKTMNKVYRDEYVEMRTNAAFQKKYGKVKRKLHVRPRLPMLPGSKISNVKRGW